MIGETIGNYKVVSLIGAGGMGEVYLAHQVTIDTRVAIKVLQGGISQDAEHVTRFFNEARAVSKVRHAGTVKIFDVGFHAGRAYLVMEFLEGESLATRIRRLGTLSGEMIAEIGRQIAGVLDAVHAVGITHRDLKPDNIYIIPDHELASGERVKVLDFGIAKLTNTLTGPLTKGTMGTPAYMAPEQWNNASNVDGRADTYSLGCVVFEMAVGRPPFPASSIGEACTHHLHSPPPRASESIPDIPVQFDTLVEQMLSKTSGARPSVKDVARALDEMRASGATARWRASAVLDAQVPPTLRLTPDVSPPPTPTPPPARERASAPIPVQPASDRSQPVRFPPPPPLHPTTMPRGQAQGVVSAAARKGLVLGGGIVAAIAVVVVVIWLARSRREDRRLAPPSPHRDAGVTIDPIAIDAPTATTPRDTLAETNRFVDIGGTRMLAHQVTIGEYRHVLEREPPVAGGASIEPIAWLTQREAAAFCQTIQARLPTTEEWTLAAKGAWGISSEGQLGPLQEWTSTIQDDLAVVRGGHAKMSADALARAGQQRPPYFLQKELGIPGADRRPMAGPTIGFRCVDGTR